MNIALVVILLVAALGTAIMLRRRSRRPVRYTPGRLTVFPNHGLALDSDAPRTPAIFEREFWLDEHGNHPPVFTTVTHDDIASGRLRPVDPAMRTDLLRYTQRLAVSELDALWPRQNDQNDSKGKV